MYPRKMLSDFLGDRVVYRNLIPCDGDLPQLADIWQEVGLETFRIPRKTEPIYAAVVYKFLQAAQSKRGDAPLKHLLVVGDTLMNDGTAARNLNKYLPTLGFIGAEKPAESESFVLDGTLMLSNRWYTLGDFLAWVKSEGVPFDEQTALLLDLDKTALGARGRNDKVIDRARVTAVRQTVEDLLGGDFDEAAFRAVYDRLNDPAYHPFTADNQDYLAYISLMVVGQVYPAAQLWTDLDAQRLTGFHQFVTLCDAHQKEMSRGLLTAHREVTGNIAKSDPTPFKSFRFREYDTTVALMDALPDDTPVAELVQNEITMTGEVAEVAGQLAAQGVLTFGLSDKPDEASTAPPGAKHHGAPPLQHVPMKVVGSLDVPFLRA